MRYASDTLVHYFKMVWEEAGLQWNADNESEIAGIIEDIVSTINRQAEKTKYAEESIQKIESIGRSPQKQLEEMRQKIASEQLAALIIRNDVPKWGMRDPNNWMIEESLRLTDLLLKKLGDKPEL